MRSRSSISIVVLFLPVIFSTALGQIKTVQKDPTAMVVLNSMYAACGWNSTLPTSIVANGTVTYPNGNSEPIVVEAVPGAFRTQMPQSNVTIVVSDVEGIMTTGTNKTPLRGGVAASIQPWMFPFYSELLNAANPSLSITSAGSGSVSGTSVQLISFNSLSSVGDGLDQIRQLASQATVSISPATFLPVQIHFYRMSRETMLSGSFMDAYLSDFRNINGMLVPFTYEERLGNQSLFTIQFQSVVFDTPIASSDFNLN